MCETVVLAGAPVISGLLIIFYDWWKRRSDNRRSKKRFELWERIYSAGTGGLEFSQPDLILYELIETGHIEFQISMGAKGNIIQAFAKGLKPSSKSPYQ